MSLENFHCEIRSSTTFRTFGLSGSVFRTWHGGFYHSLLQKHPVSTLLKYWKLSHILVYFRDRACFGNHFLKEKCAKKPKRNPPRIFLQENRYWHQPVKGMGWNQPHWMRTSSISFYIDVQQLPWGTLELDKCGCVAFSKVEEHSRMNMLRSIGFLVCLQLVRALGHSPFSSWLKTIRSIRFDEFFPKVAQCGSQFPVRLGFLCSGLRLSSVIDLCFGCCWQNVSSPWMLLFHIPDMLMVYFQVTRKHPQELVSGERPGHHE